MQFLPKIVRKYGVKFNLLISANDKLVGLHKLMKTNELFNLVAGFKEISKET